MANTWNRPDSPVPPSPIRLRFRNNSTLDSVPQTWPAVNPAYIENSTPPVPPNSPTRASAAVDPAFISPSLLREFLALDTVTIYVGPRRSVFKLCKPLLTAVSPFFKAAFSGPFKEGHDQTMDLPDDDCEAFELLTAYIYRGAFPAANHLAHPRYKLSTLIAALELAERFQMPPLACAATLVLDHTLAFSRAPAVLPQDIELAFAQLPAHAHALVLLLDHVALDFVTANDHPLPREDYGATNAAFATWPFAPLLVNVEGFDVAFARAMYRLVAKRSKEVKLAMGRYDAGLSQPVLSGWGSTF